MTWNPIAQAPTDGRVLKVRLEGQPGPTTDAYWDDDKRAWCYETSGRPVQPQPVAFRHPTLDEALKTVGEAAYNGICLVEENGQARFDGGIEAIKPRLAEGSAYTIVVPYGGRRLAVEVREVRP